jgi:hypothetical protein
LDHQPVGCGLFVERLACFGKLPQRQFVPLDLALQMLRFAVRVGNLLVEDRQVQTGSPQLAAAGDEACRRVPRTKMDRPVFVDQLARNGDESRAGRQRRAEGQPAGERSDHPSAAEKGRGQ